MKKIQGLDALRAIAVFLVIINHWGPYQFKTLPALTFIFQKVIPSGTFAVNFFFVLSGFLITGILIQSRQKTSVNGRLHALKIFIARRCLRIFPVYYLFLFLLFMINYPDIRTNIFFFATYTSNFLSFTHNSWNTFSHTWSLSVEEQFYLVWPFVILFCPDKMLLKIIVFFIVAGSIIGAATEHFYGYFSYILTFNCFNAFALGGIYAYALHQHRHGEVIKKILLYLLPLALICYIMELAGVNFLSGRLIDAIISINLIIYVSEKKYGKVAALIIDNKILNSLGKVSYGIYLFHYTVPYFYNKFLMPCIKGRLSAFFHLPTVAEFSQLVLLIALSYLSFYLIENKFLRLKKYFAYR